MNTAEEQIAGFRHHFEEINGVRLHYVRGGEGDPVVLLHGWPETWFAWRHILPGLAAQYTVIAPDLRGLGDSAKPLTGYDRRTVADDIYHLVRALGFERIFLVGHDIGGNVAYAYAASHRADVRRLVFMETALMGLGKEVGLERLLDHSEHLSPLWHVSFLGAPNSIAQALIEGKERLFLTWFYWKSLYNPTAIPADVFEVYLRKYAAAGGLRLEYYQAFYQDAVHNKESATVKLTMPVLAVGGANSQKDGPARTMRAVAQDVQSVILDQCGHYVPEEQPAVLLEHLLTFFGANSRDPHEST